MISPGCVAPGEFLVHAPSGVRVRLLNCDGDVAVVKLPNGEARTYPMRDLDQGFSPANVNGTTGAPVDPRAGSEVATGPVAMPVSAKAAKLLADALGKRIGTEEFAQRATAEANNPSLSERGGPYGRVVQRDRLTAGAPLIHKASGETVTIFAAAAERDLFVCQMKNGGFEVFRADELTAGDGSALGKSDANPSAENSVIGAAQRILGDRGSLAKSASLFKRGTRVRTRSGEVGTVLTDGSVSTVVEFQRAAGVSLEVIRNSELTIG